MKPVLSVIVETNERKTYTVWFEWSGVDRPRTSGFSVKTMKDAERVRKCCQAGKFFSHFEIVKDIDGKTYVKGMWNVNVRRLNADLKRLGF